MGWKLSLLIANKKPAVSHVELLGNWGFKNLKSIKPEIFATVINPAAGKFTLVPIKTVY